ncbi:MULTISPECIES: hypothetical protein [Yersinia]|jgi:hypothetical protein|uniref:hypothetical protein n=1 Tax=Yersinia TaxID=629 RepID=UPI0005E0269F|nr:MULTISPECIES: hypothetical protein [Yersinia]EKN3585974.1 hypothetical protein [Yersinia enterocolitica]EKN4721717.1 hypothetical protein [Yersinia enterocolitica]EKN4733634.1 hypothetical protein [Yersinia enterocolitica]EKN5072663.1 hypothetical protein [Yersinia enterocolitica]EKN6150177.1 hypothetical protein [Yersinia enterocolitica]
MAKLAPCEVSDLLNEIASILKVSSMMIGSEDGNDTGYELLWIAQERAEKAAKNIEGVNYARTAAK